MTLLRFSLFAVIALFTGAIILWGQLQYSFSIEYSITPINITGSTFEYNLWNGIKKLLDEKLYFISILLIIYSGVWPYVKLVLVTVLSFTDVVTDKHRVWLLETISSLGKWSSLDIWIVLMIIITININDTYIIMSTNVDILLQVVAMQGCYTYLIGIILSQILSLIAIHYVKASSSPLPYTLINNDNKNNNNNIFIQPNNTDDHYSMFRVISSNSLVVPLFEVKYTSFDNDLDTFTYSVLSGIEHVWITTNMNKNNKILCFVAIILVIVCPLIEVILVIAQWWVPMRVQGHRRTHEFLQKISHASCLDVFILSVIVVIHELNLFIGSVGLGQYLTVNVIVKPFTYIYIVILIVTMLLRQYMQSLVLSYMSFRTFALASSLSGGYGVDNEFMKNAFETLLNRDDSEDDIQL